jgi:flagellar M-ring protein FliF
MKNFTQSLANLWKELGLNQRVSIILAALVVTVGLASLVMWSRRPDLQLLYGRLSEKDAAAIVSQLQAQNIPHKVSNGGGSVYVPSDQVHRLRMEMAAKGVPSGDGVGFEISTRASSASPTSCNAPITSARFRANSPAPSASSTASAPPAS